MTTRASSRGGGPAAHPEKLLAPFVDDALEGSERAEVERHLAGCEACSEQVLLARGARAALRSLPEEPVPEETAVAIARAVRAETARRRGRRAARPVASSGRPPGRRATWVAGLAAAAVIVGAAAIALPRLSASSGGAATPSSNGAARPAEAPRPGASGAPLVERQDVDYDAQRVAALAATGLASPSAAGAAERSADAAGVQGADEALACVRRWTSSAEHAVPVHIIEASYEGRPAYLGVAYQAAVGAERPRVLVWVLAQRDCELISFTQQAV